MLGGDPTGTGKGGMSIYGKEFEDEIHEELKHAGEIHCTGLKQVKCW